MEGRAPEVERAFEQVHRGTRQPGLIRKVLGHRAAREGRSRRSKEGGSTKEALVFQLRHC